MHVSLTIKDIIFIIFTVILLVAVITVDILYSHNYLPHYISVIVIILVILLLENRRRSSKQNTANIDKLERIESLIFLHHSVNPKIPLPFDNSWAAAPDILNRLVVEIYNCRPKFILDIGGGISTIIMGYCLKQLGEGKIISLEHNEDYYAEMKKMVNNHDLNQIIEVEHSPLKRVRIGDRDWEWYDIETLKLEQKIDLMFVDGPPGILHKHSRYPAIPLLEKYLHPASVVILDDGKRLEEREIVELWKNKYKNANVKYIDNIKGAFIISNIVRGNNNQD